MNNSTGMDYILLYNARGANALCVQKTEASFRAYLGNRDVQLILCDASYFTEQNLKNTKAIVIPGGNASNIACSIGPEKMTSIKDFVGKGGSYIGFCAGAYLAGKSTYQYSKNDTMTLGYPPSLTSSLLHGPAFDLGDDARELGAKTAKAVLLKDFATKNSFYTFWNGGGSYSWYNTGNTFRMVSYEDANGFAMICSRENHGQVILSHVHPEIQFTQAELEDLFPLINDKDKLVDSIPQQKALFANICDLAGLDGKEKSTSTFWKYHR